MKMKIFKNGFILFLFCLFVKLQAQTNVHYFTVDKDFLSSSVAPVPGTLFYVKNQILALPSNLSHEVHIQFNVSTGLVKANQFIELVFPNLEDLAFPVISKIILEKKYPYLQNQGIDFSFIPTSTINSLPAPPVGPFGIYNYGGTFLRIGRRQIASNFVKLQNLIVKDLEFNYSNTYLNTAKREANFLNIVGENVNINNIQINEASFSDSLFMLGMEVLSRYDLLLGKSKVRSSGGMSISVLTAVNSTAKKVINDNIFDNDNFNVKDATQICNGINNYSNNIFKVINGTNYFGGELPFKFTEPNNLNEAAYNSGNKFYCVNKKDKYYSNSISQFGGGGQYELFGLDLPSSVGGKMFVRTTLPFSQEDFAGKYFIVRNCRIKASDKDLPIISYVPTLLKLKTFDVENLTANYQIDYDFSILPNTTGYATGTVVGKIAIDFYLSNSNGDLTELISTTDITGPLALSNNLIGSCTLLKKLKAAQVHRVGATITIYPDVANILPSYTCTSANLNYYGGGSISFGTTRAFYKYFAIDSCNTCLPSFALEGGKTYVVSGWAKEEGASATATNYGGNIQIKFDNLPTNTVFNFPPSGPFVEGWQRIEGEFTVPLTGAANMEINLQSSAANAVYFDDVRVHPYDGTMNSYVYNPNTLRLEAVLDERNHATIYEYDEEGKLVRVKKETERGIMTIKESRYNSVKKTQP
jgi:hypothetical protein